MNWIVVDACVSPILSAARMLFKGNNTCLQFETHVAALTG